MTLADHHIHELIVNGIVKSTSTISRGQIQPSSLDCTLGDHAWRVPAGFLPKPGERIEEILSAWALYDFDIHPGTIFERNSVYVVPLRESLALPHTLQAVSNPKSSTGRIDVFVRLLCDGVNQYDHVPVGYQGKLYLEIIPQSFLIAVSPGIALNQIRFRDDAHHLLGANELRSVHRHVPLLYSAPGTPLEEHELDVQDNGIFLTADLLQSPIAGYRAKDNPTGIIDLRETAAFDTAQFWERIQGPLTELILAPHTFYIISSREYVSLNLQLAAELEGINTTAGELRSHYAGFIDPGWGWSNNPAECGSSIVLEVRAYDVPFRLTHGQRISRMTVERLAEPTENPYEGNTGTNAHYTSQRGPRLAKYFT